MTALKLMLKGEKCEANSLGILNSGKKAEDTPNCNLIMSWN